MLFTDFFTYNDRYDEENYEYDYPEGEVHEFSEEVRRNIYNRLVKLVCLFVFSIQYMLELDRPQQCQAPIERF